jgi:hypothetical protein
VLVTNLVLLQVANSDRADLGLATPLVNLASRPLVTVQTMVVHGAAAESQETASRRQLRRGTAIKEAQIKERTSYSLELSSWVLR